MLSIFLADQGRAIEVVLDFTLDEKNYNWFDPLTPDGLARRQALQCAAGFLSTIITNDDWSALPSLNESISFTDLSESIINDLDGNEQTGTPESDGAGYVHPIATTNRSSVLPNQYVVYVGAFHFDSGTSSHAKGGWDSADRRNPAGFAGTEFNTWGGKIVFDLGESWYWGSSPGINPTNNYGVQDPDKDPLSDILSDNWNWHTSLLAWKGFELSTLDPSAETKADLFGTAMHELVHTLGLTSSNYTQYVGANASGEATGANMQGVYGGPVPLSPTGGHFDFGTQSEVWDSDGIIAEALMDPNSTSGNRKYLTELDAAALRDLGYNVAATWEEVAPPLNLAISVSNDTARIDWVLSGGSTHTVQWSTDFLSWNSIPVGAVDHWIDSAPIQGKKFYRVMR